MRAWLAWLCCLPGLMLLGCDSTNPVEPPPPATGGSSFTITLTSQQSSLAAGSTTGLTITVTAASTSGGAPPADGTEIGVSTNLGNFGLDQSGNPIQTTTVALTGGSAQVVFFAGSSPGTANLLAQLGNSTARLNIAISDPGTPPVAGFSFTTNGLQALFTDSSTGDPTAWSWSFGDGQSSTQQSPLHTYAQAGTYVVELTVTNAAGSNSTRKFVTVSPLPNPMTASFTVSIDGLTVLFTDTSAGSPTSWDWDFGDGGASTAQNPTHTYSVAGTYRVSLTVANSIGQNASTSTFVTVPPAGAAPSAAFTVTFNGLTAIFTDTSTGSDLSWSWNFGDGSAIVTTQNPSHTYAAAGTYRVTLTVTNTLGSDSTNQVITVPPAGSTPTAAFTFQASGLQVAFTDASTGSPTSWLWDFGDGSSGSTERNPVHGYAAAGTYTVRLTAANASGSSSVSQFVDVAGPLEASFEFSVNGLTVVFTDTSTGSPTSWQWDFGDGATSTAQNPSRTYAAAGSYTVTLTVRRGNESVFVRRTVTVGGG